ncbi:hypothetical protein L484_004318 [Morus notabilis]|uniref:B-like cyclin n=1 Tax=Morus notabilis TaxID=981085 RepID=W9S461_9ROSA|nr:hypothetical protein L484_004318 [Morus notabilis]
MELLVLSTLEWKMNPVTPISFLDSIIRRLGLKDHLCWEFLKRCENIILSLISDIRKDDGISSNLLALAEKKPAELLKLALSASESYGHFRIDKLMSQCSWSKYYNLRLQKLFASLTKLMI